MCLLSNTYMSGALKTEVAPNEAAGDPRIGVVYPAHDGVEVSSQLKITVKNTTLGVSIFMYTTPCSLL